VAGVEAEAQVRVVVDGGEILLEVLDARGQAAAAAGAGLDEQRRPALGLSAVEDRAQHQVGIHTEVPDAEFRRVTEVTYGGTVNGTRAALRRMVPRNSGVVVNVCSAIAFHGLPMLSSYSGAKHAVRGFTDSVRHELIGDGSRVRMTTVFPPAVNTPFFSHAVSYMPKSPRPAKPVYQPEVVAAAIHLAALRGRPEMVVSGTAAAFSLAARVSPRLIAFAMTRLGLDGQLTCDPEVARLEQPPQPGGRDLPHLGAEDTAHVDSSSMAKNSCSRSRRSVTSSKTTTPAPNSAAPTAATSSLCTLRY
jgi:NAD(P)-dependent dehydrogenase (short-subunit alcohol dehydrogenase family)